MVLTHKGPILKCRTRYSNDTYFMCVLRNAYESDQFVKVMNNKAERCGRVVIILVSYSGGLWFIYGDGDQQYVQNPLKPKLL